MLGNFFFFFFVCLLFFFFLSSSVFLLLFFFFFFVVVVVVVFNQLFPKKKIRNTIRVPTVWTQISPDFLSGQIWVQTVCKDYHQKKKSSLAGKGLTIQLNIRIGGIHAQSYKNFKCQHLSHFSTNFPSVCTIVAGYYGFTLVVRVSVCPSVCPSVRRTSVRPSVFRFRMIHVTWVNINGFSPNLVCALIFWRSGLGLLIGQILWRYLPETRPYFRFRTITWVNIKGFSPNLLYALTLRRSGLGLIMDKFRQFLRSYLPETRPCFRFRTITWVNNKGFSPNLLYALTLRRSGLGLLTSKFRQFVTETRPYFRFRTITLVNNKGF